MTQNHLCFLAACALVACGGGDPGGQTSTQGDDGGGGPFAAGPSLNDAGGPMSVADAAPPVVHVKDAAPPPVVDPVVAGTLVDNPQDAFTGAASYVSKPPSIRANDQHSGTVVTGQPCLSCHDGTTCTKFDFAGTVWQAPALTVGAPDVEVRIIDANNYAHDVHSDVDGNFWHRATNDLALPAFSGVRVAGWKAIGSLNGVSCNTCHNTGTQTPGRLFVQKQ